MMKNIFYLCIIIVSLILITSSCVPETYTPSSNYQTTIIDTAYGTHSKQKMDIYLPYNRNSTTPIVFMIHGGAWEAGDKSDMNVIKDQIKNKWPEAAVVNINYRLTSDSTIHHTEIMNDIQSALNFVVNNQSILQVSNKFYMVGASAGGQLAMLYTYQYNTNNYVKAVANYFGPSLISDWSWYNSFNIWLGVSVKDILIKYTGSTWDNTLYDAVSPYKIVNSSSKPTIAFHGTLDVIVPIYQNQWMHSKLDSLGVTNEYYEYVDGHGFNSENYSNSAQKMVTFFKRH